ncbi:MAG: dUTP diphosphatase [Clostridia bacterium]|nr:dUTP diphosphatase [Clostridia bacterium]
MEDREKVKVYIEKCHLEARIPSYARCGDAGMDIYAVEDTIIQFGKTVIVKTGLKVAIAEGFEIQIRPRSGMSIKTPLRVANSPGTIDAGYRDEIGIIMHNTSTEQDYQIKKGDRIAQMVIQKVPMIEWIPVENVEKIGENRGGGFGSSGR